VSEVIIFAFGCFVSLIVLSAVGLLLWGAANEPGTRARANAQGSKTGKALSVSE
jgi:hypothetical protein